MSTGSNDNLLNKLNTLFADNGRKPESFLEQLKHVCNAADELPIVKLTKGTESRIFFDALLKASDHENTNVRIYSEEQYDKFMKKVVIAGRPDVALKLILTHMKGVNTARPTVILLNRLEMLSDKCANLSASTATVLTIFRQVLSYTDNIVIVAVDHLVPKIINLLEPDVLYLKPLTMTCLEIAKTANGARAREVSSVAAACCRNDFQLLFWTLDTSIGLVIECILRNQTPPSANLLLIKNILPEFASQDLSDHHFRLVEKITVITLLLLKHSSIEVVFTTFALLEELTKTTSKLIPSFIPNPISVPELLEEIEKKQEAKKNNSPDVIIDPLVNASLYDFEPSPAVSLDLNLPEVAISGEATLVSYLIKYLFQEFVLKQGVRSSLRPPALQCLCNLIVQTKNVAEIEGIEANSKELSRICEFAVSDDDGVAFKAIQLMSSIEYLSIPTHDYGFFETYRAILYMPNAIMRQKCLIENFSGDRFYTIFHRPIFKYLLSFALEKAEEANYAITCGEFLASIDLDVFNEKEKLHKKPLIRTEILLSVGSFPNSEGTLRRLMKTIKKEKDEYTKLFSLPLISNMDEGFNFKEITYGQYRRYLDEFFDQIVAATFSEVKNYYETPSSAYITFHSFLVKNLPATLYSYNVSSLKNMIGFLENNIHFKRSDITAMYMLISYLIAGKSVKLIHSDAYEDVKVAAQSSIVASLRVFNLYFTLISLESLKDNDLPKILRLLSTTPKREDISKLVGDHRGTTNFELSKSLKGIFDDMKGSYKNYLKSLDPEIDERFTSLLEAAVSAFCASLELLKFEDFLYYDETLVYLKKLISVDAKSSFRVIQQLLKCLLGRNMVCMNREEFRQTISLFGSTPGQSCHSVFDLLEELQNPERILKMEMGWLRPELLLSPSRNNPAIAENLPKLDESMTYMIKLYRFQGNDVKAQTLSLMGELLRSGIQYDMADPQGIIKNDIKTVEDNLTKNLNSDVKPSTSYFNLLPEIALFLISYSRSGNYDVKKLPILSVNIIQTIRKARETKFVQEKLISNALLSVQYLVLECKRISMDVEDVVTSFIEFLESVQTVLTESNCLLASVLLQSTKNRENSRKTLRLFLNAASKIKQDEMRHNVNEAFQLMLFSIEKNLIAEEVQDVMIQNVENRSEFLQLHHCFCLNTWANGPISKKFLKSFLSQINRADTSSCFWNAFENIFLNIRRWSNNEWNCFLSDMKIEMDPNLNDYASRRLAHVQFKLPIEKEIVEQSHSSLNNSIVEELDRSIDWLHSDKTGTLISIINSGSIPPEGYKFITGLDVPDIQTIIETTKQQYKKNVVDNTLSAFYARLGELEVLSSQKFIEMKLRIEEVMEFCLESDIQTRGKLGILNKYNQFSETFGLKYSLDQTKICEMINWVAEQDVSALLPEDLAGLTVLLRHKSTTESFFKNPWALFRELVRILNHFKTFFEDDYSVFPINPKLAECLTINVPEEVPKEMKILLESYSSVQDALKEAFILVKSAFSWIKNPNMRNCYEMLEVVKHILRHRILYEIACVSTEAMEYSWIPRIDVNPAGNVTVPLPQIHLLSQPNVIQHFERRLSWLGWISREQFEDTWMNLFGVLSSTPTGEEVLDGQEDEISERVENSIKALRFLTRLLLRSLTYPIVGDPSSNFVVKPRTMTNAFLETTDARKAAVYKSRLTNSSPRNALVYNVEYPFETAKEYKCGLLSAGWLVNFTRNGEEVRKQTQGIKPSISTFVMETTCDLDISSSIRALLDIIGHWFQRGLGNNPSKLLSQVIISIVSLSDLFEDEEQYQFMFRELTKIKCRDSGAKSYLSFGIFKAIAVVGLEQIAPFMSMSEKMKHIQNITDEIISGDGTWNFNAITFLMQTLDPIPMVHSFVVERIGVLRVDDLEDIDNQKNKISNLFALAVAFFQVPSDAKIRKNNELIIQDMIYLWSRPNNPKKIDRFLTNCIETIVIYTPEVARVILPVICDMINDHFRNVDHRSLLRIFGLCTIRTSPLSGNLKQIVISSIKELLNLMKDVKLSEAIIISAPSLLHLMYTPKEVICMLLQRCNENKMTKLISEFMKYLEEFDAGQVEQCRGLIRDFVKKETEKMEQPSTILFQLAAAAAKLPDMQFLSIAIDIFDSGRTKEALLEIVDS